MYTAIKQWFFILKKKELRPENVWNSKHTAEKINYRKFANIL